MARSKVELFEAIRRDERRDGVSIRALADRHGVHRRTVRQALDNAVPPERKTPVRAAPKLDPAKPLIDAMLIVDLTAPRKQRHPARRVLARLVEEHQMSDLTYSAVRDYVAKRRPEIWAAAGRSVEEGFVPQTHEPARRRRSTSRICGSIWLGSAPSASCSRCGSRSRASRSTGPTPPKGKKRSWRAISRRSTCWVAHRSTRSATTI